MIIIDAPQGSRQWLDIRAKTLNASEAPAMMGVSNYMTRAELLRDKKLGVPREYDQGALARFRAGHEAEASARVLVEQAIGEDLFPVVATTDDGRLLASSDGVTLLGDAGYEHKLWNEGLAASVREGLVPESHRWQLDQQIHVLGLEKIIFVVSDGTADRFVQCEYRTTPERIQQLLDGWDQFEKDLADFEIEPEVVKPVGRAPESLPALRIEVTGMVTASNLQAFKDHALAVFADINTDLQTDADFADAEKTVKWCKEVEDKLDGAKQHALSQTASIDDLFRTIDAIKDESRTVRLKLDKLVKAEKENRRVEIVRDAQAALTAHVAALNQRLGGNYLLQINMQQFGEAIKGLKSLDSMRDKVSAALANAKIDANAVADRIDANRKSVDDMSLFPDFAQVCTKAPDDFAAMLSFRKQQRTDAEAKRLEAEREKIRAEEQAKAQREASARAAAEQAERDKLQREDRARQHEQIASRSQQEVATTPVAQPAPAETGALIPLGKINERLSPIALSVAGIASLGVHPTERRQSAALYRESDVARICAALVRHLNAVAVGMKEAA